MTGPRDDRELAALFRAARERDGARTPGFERVLAGRPRRQVRLGWILAAAGAATIAMVAGLRSRSGPSAERPVFVFVPGQLRTPTDFLIDPGGTAFLRAIPQIGGGPSISFPTGLDHTPSGRSPR